MMGSIVKRLRGRNGERKERGEELGEELRGRWKRDVRDCEKGFGRRQTVRKKLGEELGKKLGEELGGGAR